MKDDFILAIVVAFPLCDVEDDTFSVVLIAGGWVIEVREMLIDYTSKYLIIFGLDNYDEARWDSLPGVVDLHGGEIVSFDRAYSLIRHNIDFDGLVYEELEIIEVVDYGWHHEVIWDWVHFKLLALEVGRTGE